MAFEEFMILWIAKQITKLGVTPYKAQFVAWGVVALIVLIVILFIGNYIQSCWSKNEQKKIEVLKEEIITKKIEANYAANVVNAAANKSNQALEKVDAVRAANVANVKVGEAITNLCAVYPEDELCK